MNYEIRPEVLFALNKNVKRKANPYIGFDDTWAMIIGMPIVSFITTMLMTNITFEVMLENLHRYWSAGFAYTFAYWMINRQQIIFWRKRFTDTSKAVKRNIFQVVTAFLLAPVISIVVTLVLMGLAAIFGNEYNSKENTGGIIVTYLVTFAVLMFYEAVYFFQEYKKALVIQERIKTEHINTQLINLRNQVNPHFLFNSLNTLMSLIPAEAENAHEYLTKLSKFYRYSVSEKNETTIPLEKEINMVKLYGELIKERFGDSFSLEVKVTDLEGEYLLPMTLQLLAENAVKHNIVSREDPLRIVVYRDRDYLHVENNLQKRITQTDSTGMGLENIRQRYAYFSDRPVLVDESKNMFRVSVPFLKAAIHESSDH